MFHLYIKTTRLSAVWMLQVCRNTDWLYARPDRRCCAETSADGAATFSTTWLLSAEAGAENTEISPTSSGQHHVFSLVLKFG